MNNRIALLGHSQEYARSLRNLGDHLDFHNRLGESVVLSYNFAI